MDLGQVLERGLRWGLPVAPLTVAILYLVTWTPSAAVGERSYLLYMACMAGAALGLVGIMVACRYAVGRKPAASLVLALGLEVSWVLLVLAARSGVAVVTAVGAGLASACTAAFVLLWLLEAPSDARCQLAGYATALLAGFILYALVTLTPDFGWLTFGLPPLTGIPLARRLRSRKEEKDEEPEAQAGGGIRQIAAVCLEAVLLGGCLRVVGFGVSQLDSSVMLAGIALGCLLFLRSGWSHAPSQLVVPFAVSGMCASLTPLADVALSLFLGGCVCMLVWVVMERKGAGSGGTLGLGGVLLLVTVCAMAGMSAAQVLIGVLAVDGLLVSLGLIAALVVVDGMRHVVLDGLRGEGALTSVTVDYRAGVLALGERYGFSQREIEVAELVCRGCGVRGVSQELGVALSTVKSHVQHVYAKAGVHSRDELRALAEDLGMRDFG